MSSSNDPAIAHRPSRKGKEREVAPLHPDRDAAARDEPGMAEQLEHFKTQLRDLLRARNAEKDKHSAETRELEQTILDTQQSLRAAQSALSKRDAEITALREDLLRRPTAAPTARSAAAEDAVRELERELRRLRCENAALSKDALGWETERVRLADTVRAEQKKAGAAVEEARALRANRERAVERRVGDERERARLEEEALAARSEVADARTWLRSAATECERLQDEKRTLVRNWHTAQALAAARESGLRNELDVVREQQIEAEREVTYLRQRGGCIMTEWDASDRDYQVQLAVAKQMRQDLEREIKADRQASEAAAQAQEVCLRGTRQHLSEALEDADLLRQELAAQRTCGDLLSAELQSQLDLAHAEKAELAAELAGTQASAADLASDLAQARSQLTALQANYAASSEAHAAQATELGAAHEELAQLQAQTSKERAKWEERKEVVKRLGGDLGMLGTGYEALERECGDLRVALAEHQSTAAVLEALRLDHRIVQDKLAQYQYEAHELGNLNASLSGVQPAFGDRVAYIQGLRVELSETKEALISTRAHLAASRTKTAALSKELDIYRAQDIPLHAKPVAKRITVARVRDPLSSSVAGNGVGRQ